MTRWLVTGARGQLGTDLVGALAGTDCTAWGHDQLDLTDQEAVLGAVRRWARSRPGTGPGDADLVVLNTAAYTDVDRAETERERAFAVNADGAGALAAAAAEVGATLVHVSTDYVFDGSATEPYEVDAPTRPRTVYGASKLDGEQRVRDGVTAHYVVRTAWVYGHAGRNFVRTMARLEGTHEQVDVVDDQHGSPTWSGELAAGLVRLATSGVPYGTYHATGAGATTWHGFARAVFAELGADPDRVRPCGSAQLVRPAPRPAFSVLSNGSWSAAGLPPLRPWRDALAAAITRHGAELRT